MRLEDVCIEIINQHRVAYEESPTPLKLQKLCYYAQGIYLALNDNNELFSEDFEAWKLGPVIPTLYKKYRHYGWKPINEEYNQTSLPEATKEFISNIITSYGQYDGAALSTMTHRESPWLNARKGLLETENCEEVITKASLKDFFTGVLAL